MIPSETLKSQLKHRSRVKKRYLSGDIENFSRRDMIELLLFYTFRRTDTKTAARKLISRFGSLEELFGADEKDIEAVDSIGSETARFMLLTGCIMERYRDNIRKSSKSITVPEDAEEIFSEIFSSGACDCAVLFTDGTGNILHILSADTPGEIIKDGSFDRILSTGATTGAAGFFFGEKRIHGLIKPMKEDIEFARLMKNAADTAGIEYCNHIIIGKDSTCIFSHTGCFPCGMFTYT